MLPTRAWEMAIGGILAFDHGPSVFDDRRVLAEVAGWLTFSVLAAINSGMSAGICFSTFSFRFRFLPVFSIFPNNLSSVILSISNFGKPCKILQILQFYVERFNFH